MTRSKEIFDLLIDEANRPFKGWDFSYITQTERIQSEPLPWSYASIIIPYVRKAPSLLDMGTGGGELLSLLQPLPKYTVATEAYEPNVPIARKRLEPLGAHVIQIEEDMNLPFKENEFELIINRHESYDPVEIRRILQPSGYFITQQVGNQNDLDINRFLGNESLNEERGWNADFAAKELQDHGFNILNKMETFPKTRFYDVGALVFYLKAIPWVVEEFTVEKYLDALLLIHDRIIENGFIEISEHRFLIISQNTMDK